MYFDMSHQFLQVVTVDQLHDVQPKSSHRKHEASGLFLHEHHGLF